MSYQGYTIEPRDLWGGQEVKGSNRIGKCSGSQCLVDPGEEKVGAEDEA
jgi:hypothetical protein